uniref:FAD-dependent oxidoreductase domain-containing protein 1 n=1 Tax=Plectus sambesii TaxID=2011161 RepID=A0A914W269_9BILA
AKYDAYERRGLLSHAKREVMMHELFPYEADFLIIGGGIVGSSVAWWLKQRLRDEDLSVVVVENDDTFKRSSTILAAGGIRQQFSIPENVEMSMFTAEFLRNAGEHLQILDNDPPDVNVLPMGYLFLASTEEGAETMKKNWRMQTGLGAKVALLNKEELKLRFPFMNFDDVVMGSFGLENEGAIDPWQLLSAIREKNITLGVQYIKGDVEGFMFTKPHGFQESHGFVDDEEADDANYRMRRMSGVYVRPQMTDASPRPIRAYTIVNAAGPWAGKVAAMAGIGKGKGLLSIPLPVEPRKRYVYVVHVPDGPAIDMPFLIDPSGVYCRQEDVGHTYICGSSPTMEEDGLIDHSNLDVDYDYFYEKIWPVLAKRIPAFEKLKVKSAWAGYYDYNTFDQNAFIGPHLVYDNFFQVNGFSGHGLQHAIAAGRGLMERFYDGAYTSINMRKFDMRRLVKNAKLEEDGIV